MTNSQTDERIFELLLRSNYLIALERGPLVLAAVDERIGRLI